MAAVREAPPRTPAEPEPPRRRLGARALAAAAAFSLVVGVAAFWVVRAGSEPALAQAADATEATGSARFTFEAEFSVEVDVPDIERRLEDFGRELEDRVIGPVQRPPDPVIPEELKDLIRERLERARREIGERLERELHRLPSLALGGIHLTISGEGAFAGPDRVRLEGDVRVTRPDAAEGSFEVLRVGGRLFVQAEDAGWRALRRGLPTRALQPVGVGLERMAEWIRGDGGLAEKVGEENLDGIETERFRLDHPANRPGTRSTIDVWIGVDDDLIHRILVRQEFERGPATSSGRMDIRLFDHGADVDIEAPEGAEEGTGDAFLPRELSGRLGEIDLWFGADFPGPPGS